MKQLVDATKILLHFPIWDGLRWMARVPSPPEGGEIHEEAGRTADELTRHKSSSYG